MTCLAELNKMADQEVETYWKAFEDVSIDEDAHGRYIANDWLIFDAGTSVKDIWIWFDSVHSKGILWLANDYEG